ncbi:unnamed protein product [Symbiodinium sp. CCMP2592]|nr:unnamed protein product [Symbiodinium sp. CCMP2592]
MEHMPREFNHDKSVADFLKHKCSGSVNEKFVETLTTKQRKKWLRANDKQKSQLMVQWDFAERRWWDIRKGRYPPADEPGLEATTPPPPPPPPPRPSDGPQAAGKAGSEAAIPHRIHGEAPPRLHDGSEQARASGEPRVDRLPSPEEGGPAVGSVVVPQRHHLGVGERSLRS